MKEHQRHLRLGQIEKSAIAEHGITEQHSINFNETKLMARSLGYWDRVIKEAIVIRMERNNFNRDAGYHLSNIWKPLIGRIARDKDKQGDKLALTRPRGDIVGK